MFFIFKDIHSKTISTDPTKQAFNIVRTLHIISILKSEQTHKKTSERLGNT
jgi:hypothetical protein